MSSTVDLYHFMIINLTIFLTFLKLVMLLEGILFVRISDNAYISTMDNLEIFPLTPRYLALFSVSFFAAGEFIGKTQTDRTQFNFQRRCPFFIAALHTLILVMRRRYQFTVDDFVILLVFVTSLSVRPLLKRIRMHKKKSRRLFSRMSFLKTKDTVKEMTSYSTIKRALLRKCRQLRNRMTTMTMKTME